MVDLFFYVPTQIFFGSDTINRLGTIVSQLGKHVLIVTEAILYENKIINRVQDILYNKGVNTITYDEVVPNATSVCVDEGIKLAKGAHIDVIVGLGGVKTLNISKCIAMSAKSKKTFDDLMTENLPETTPLAYIEIPTTCRNPFMLKDEYFIADARNRLGRLGKTQNGITKAVIVDPKLSESLPGKYTATTILDTLLHAIEGYISSKANFISDTLFIQAIKLIGRLLSSNNIEKLRELKSRVTASKAGTLTALGLSSSRAGLGAALSYALNARCMVPKSWTTTILLPHVMEYHVGAAAEKFVQIGQLLNIETEGQSAIEAANTTIEKVRTIIGAFHLPSRLNDFDLNLDEMIEIAEMAKSYDYINYLPRIAGREELYEVIKSAF
jgi:alcohol dehydrogenase class IV